MLTLVMTLALSIHPAPPSSLHLVEAQPEVTGARLVEVERALTAVPTKWPTGSLVLMAVGFGGAATFSLVGFAIGIALSGLPGIFILAVGLAAGGLTLMLGIAGVIWGAAQSGADRRRVLELEAEREQLQRQAQGTRVVRPALFTLATF